MCRFYRGGFGVSRVPGLANSSSRASGFMFKSYGFSGFEMCHGLQVLPFFELGFGHFHPKFLFFWVFVVMQSM